MTIRLYEVRIETPVGRNHNILTAAHDEANARDIAVGLIRDFQGSGSHVYRDAQTEATTAEVEVKELTKHDAA